MPKDLEVVSQPVTACRERRRCLSFPRNPTNFLSSHLLFPFLTLPYVKITSSPPGLKWWASKIRRSVSSPITTVVFVFADSTAALTIWKSASAFEWMTVQVLSNQDPNVKRKRCLFSVFIRNWSFVDWSVIESVKCTAFPSTPFVLIRLVESFVLGPEQYPSNTTTDSG